MRIFYFRNPASNLCPVREYLKFFLGENKLLADIDGKIRSIATKGHFFLPIAKPLHNYSAFEIIKSFGDKNIRILCAIVDDELILFHAFDKPAHYENIKKINKQIKQNCKIAEEYFIFYKNEKDKENYKEEYR